MSATFKEIAFLAYMVNPPYSGEDVEDNETARIVVFGSLCLGELQFTNGFLKGKECTH